MNAPILSSEHERLFQYSMCTPICNVVSCAMNGTSRDSISLVSVALPLERRLVVGT